MSSSEEWFERGKEAYNAGRYGEALEAFDEAIRLDPDYALPWHGKGTVLRSLSRYGEALEAYDEAIRLDPDYALPWNGKGTVLRSLGRYGEALEAFDESLRLDPDCALPWNGKGVVLRSLSRYGEALEAYDEALRLDPDNAYPWYNRSLTLRQIDRTIEADRCLFHVVYLAARAPGAKRFEALEVVPKVLEHLQQTRAAPLLVLSLFHQYDLLEVYLREPAFYREARERACSFLLTQAYLDSGRSLLNERDQWVTLGLGAFYLGDPFLAQAYFSRLDDDYEDDLLGQFYYGRTYQACAVENEGLLRIGRGHARAKLTAAGQGEPVEAEQLYYGGQLFALDFGAKAEPLLALRCFEVAAERGFLPARYLQAFVLDALDRRAERDAVIEELLWQERLLIEGHQEGFLRGTAAGHIEVSEQGWEQPFRKYAHAAEIQDAVGLVYAWLAERERADGSLPPAWVFIDRPGSDRAPDAWEGWVLADAAIADIEEAVSAAKNEQLALMRQALAFAFGAFVDAEASSSALEEEVARRVDVVREGDDLAPYVNLIRYFALSGRLEPRASLLLALYVLARHGGEDPFKDLGEKVLESSATAWLDEPVDALLVLFGLGGSLVGAPLAAGAGAVLAHLIVRYAKGLRRQQVRAQFYGAFKRDFYQYIGQMQEQLGSALSERLAALVGLGEEAP